MNKTDVKIDETMRELTQIEIQNVSGGIGIEWGHTHNSVWVKPFLGRRPGRG